MRVSEITSVSEIAVFIISRGMDGTGRVARKLLQMRPQFYSRNLKGEDLGRPTRRQTDNIKLNRRMINCEGND
jgi:hypothetical protein